MKVSIDYLAWDMVYAGVYTRVAGQYNATSVCLANSLLMFSFNPQPLLKV